MRVSKKHDIRLQEILDASASLFMQKGYDKTTINDILERVDIGKGTFYHYFKSKEEVMDAIISRMLELVVKAAKTVADDETIGAREKMRQIIFSLNVSQNPDGQILEELHQPANAQMHQKSITQTIQAVAPIIGEVVKQGIEEGIYKVEYPCETIEFLLVANQFIFDQGIMRWTPEETASRRTAFVHMIERSLGAAEGSFGFMLENGETNA